MKKITTVTVGIPVYNEASNIKVLLKDVFAQKQSDFKVTQILVSSDGSTDDTLKIVKSLKDSRITVIENRNTQGIARGLNQIIVKSTGDILITLDGDIRILDTQFFAKLILPILAKKADLTSSNIAELAPKSHFARTLLVSMRLKEVLFNTFKNGDNIYTCHGLARGYSRKFYKALHFPVSVGNDMYSYLSCITQKLRYVYVPKAIAWYRLPETFADQQKQSMRFFVSSGEQEKHFDSKLIHELLTIPIPVYIAAGLKAFPVLLKYPFHSVAYFSIQLYSRFRSKMFVANQVWEIATTSKKL